MRGLGFESYVCQLCVVILLLPFNNTYEYGIDDVNCLGWRISSNVIWHSGCALALGVEGHWWVLGACLVDDALVCVKQRRTCNSHSSEWDSRKTA